MSIKAAATLSGLQWMRALAALMVVLHHCMEEASAAQTSAPPDWLVTAGAAGVDIFFVISGFIMMAISFRNPAAPDKVGYFLQKRINRIYPLYWISALVVLCAQFAGFYNSLELTPADIARSLLLAPADTLIVGVSWTLVHEMNFYLLFALLLFFRSSWKSLAGVTLLVAAEILLARFIPDKAVARYYSNPISIEFCFGLALGYAWLKGWRWTQWRLRASILAMIAIIAAPLFVAHADTSGLPGDMRVWVWGLPSMVLVAACLSLDGARTAVGRRAVLLGDASYAIYLMHPFVMLVYAKALRASSQLSALPQVPLIVLAFLASAALGVAAHLYLERPISELLKKRTPRASAPAL